MTAHRQARALQSVDAEIKADLFGYALRELHRIDAECRELHASFMAKRRDDWAAFDAAIAALATPEPRSQGEVK